MPVLSKVIQRGCVGGLRGHKRPPCSLTDNPLLLAKQHVTALLSNIHKASVSTVLHSDSSKAPHGAHRNSCLLREGQMRLRSSAISVPEVLETTRVEDTSTEQDVKPFEDIPGPPPLSLFGTMVQRLPGGRLRNVDSVEKDNQMYRDYGPVVKESVGNTFTVVHLFDPVDIETVYRSDGKIPQRHAFFMLESYNKRSNHVQGLLTSHDEHWAHLRKNVQQKMLRPKAVSAYLADQSIVGDDLLNRIEALCDENGDVENLMETLYKYATECIGVVCFNVRLGSLRSHSVDSETTKFIKAVQTVMEISHQEFMKFPLYRWFRTPMFNRMVRAQDFIRSMAVKYSDIAVKAKMDGDNEISGEEGDLIPYLIAKTSLSKSEVHTVISEFIFAGVDTTSHYLAFALFSLAKNPEKQALLAEEIDKVFNKGNDVTSSKLGHMPYLRAVLKETLRDRSVLAVICSYNHSFETFVGMHNDHIQRQDKYFKQADQFVPERWLRGEEQEQCHPFASIPFGFGSRSCIGKRFAEQEVSLALIKILKKYRIETYMRNLTLKKSITYTPTEPLKLRFIAR